jgi:hypothetical protein
VGAAFEFALPGARVGDVLDNDADFRVKLAEYGCVRDVLIDSDDFAQVLLFETGEEILPYEAGCPGDHNFT